MTGPIVTVIPQTGSTASVGRGTGDAPDAASPSTRIARTTAARIDSASSGGVRAPMSSPTCRCTRAASASGSASSARRAAPRVWLHTTPTNPTPASSAARTGPASSPWVATTTAVAPSGPASAARRTTKPRPSARPARASAVGEVPVTCRTAGGSNGSR